MFSRDSDFLQLQTPNAECCKNVEGEAERFIFASEHLVKADPQKITGAQLLCFFLL